MERTCNKCGATKAMDQFKPDRTCANGYRHSCLACFQLSQRDRHSAGRSSPEYMARMALARRKHDLKRKYGLTLEQADAMLSLGKGCQICGAQQTKRLAIDHCHATGKVRGALCTKCNNALGLFNDSVKLLNKAARYLLSTQNDRSSDGTPKTA